MALALRRSRLMDTFLVSVLILTLSAIHFVLPQYGRGWQFNNPTRKRSYMHLLGVSWPLLGVGGLPLLAMWFMGRSQDRVHFSSATAKHMSAVMVSAGLVAVGCTLVTAAEIVWVLDIGFSTFNVVILLGIISLILLGWISIQVFFVVREAANVRRSILESQRNAGPQPGDLEFQSDGDRRTESKDNPFA